MYQFRINFLLAQACLRKWSHQNYFREIVAKLILKPREKLKYVFSMENFVREKLIYFAPIVFYVLLTPTTPVYRYNYSVCIQLKKPRLRKKGKWLQQLTARLSPPTREDIRKVTFKLLCQKHQINVYSNRENWWLCPKYTVKSLRILCMEMVCFDSENNKRANF